MTSTPRQNSGSLARWVPWAAWLGFLTLDWALLAALPRLGLSYGPVLLPFLCLFVARAIIDRSYRFAWEAPRVWRRLRRAPANSASATGVAISLALLLAQHILLTALVIDAFYLEPFDLRVTRLSLPPGNPASSSSRRLRIVQLADLHIERTTPRERELIPLVNALEPDLIVMTGDYLNLAFVGDPLAMQDARALLSLLRARQGIYAVAGTVDPPGVMADLFAGLDITVLDDAIHPVKFEGQELYLVGVSNRSGARDAAVLSELMSQIPLEAYTLLLYHSPDLIEAASRAGVDLFLAGHTHGGQIRLPFYGAIITFSAYGKRYEQGLYSLNGTTLYVSRGIGLEGLGGAPRARFLCLPEVVVLDLAWPARP